MVGDVICDYLPIARPQTKAQERNDPPIPHNHSKVGNILKRIILAILFQRLEINSILPLLKETQ